MKRRIATGIDIGTYQIKMVVVEEVADKDGSGTRVIGTGSAPTRGMHQGYVVNKEEVTESIRMAKQSAEQAARVYIRNGFLSLGSVSTGEARATGEAIISRADQEITDLDMETARKSAREAATPNFLNHRVLHEIPIEYRVDGVATYGNPVGMKGMRLEADFLFITCLATHIDTLVATAEDADIEIIDQMVSPLAGSYVTLTNDQKMRGCLLANIGAETTSIAVYDEGIPLSVHVFPTGGMQITDDIALAFKIPLEDAERLKLGRLGGAMYPRKKVDDIINSRLTRIFQLIDKHLKSLSRSGPLPAGVILSGGGSGSTSAIDLTRKVLSLPARQADMFRTRSSNTKPRDGIWAVAYGIALWGLTGDIETGASSNILGKIFKWVRKTVRQFLP
ncbi:hypothetical protein MNBD_CPR01-439 [hydrothermal vent metagenome]|uniref:SHS2 domain-containing protein n=1 Tax=hydrothermal vent metagenome TaxID=652676 RepID=A0A3B0V310_9ZZZZ